MQPLAASCMLHVWSRCQKPSDPGAGSNGTLTAEQVSAVVEPLEAAVAQQPVGTLVETVGHYSAGCQVGSLEMPLPSSQSARGCEV